MRGGMAPTSFECGLHRCPARAPRLGLLAMLASSCGIWSNWRKAACVGVSLGLRNLNPGCHSSESSSVQPTLCRPPFLARACRHSNRAGMRCAPLLRDRESVWPQCWCVAMRSRLCGWSRSLLDCLTRARGRVVDRHPVSGTERCDGPCFALGSVGKHLLVVVARDNVLGACHAWALGCVLIRIEPICCIGLAGMGGSWRVVGRLGHVGASLFTALAAKLPEVCMLQSKRCRLLL